MYNILYIYNTFLSAVMHSFGMKYVKNMVLYLNVLVIIWLLVTYTLLFGLSSLEKYFGKEVNIIQKEENPTAIDPPGEMLSLLMNMEDGGF